MPGRLTILALTLALCGCSEYALQPGDPDRSSEPADDAPAPVPDDLVDLEDECSPIAWLECGDVVTGDSGDPAFGRTDLVDFWPVSQGNYRGPEVAYAWEGDRSGTIEWRLVHPRPTQVDHDLFVLDGDRACRADAAIARGFNDVEFDGSPGEIRVLVLDGFDGDVGEYEVELRCPDGA